MGTFSSFDDLPEVCQGDLLLVIYRGLDRGYAGHYLEDGTISNRNFRIVNGWHIGDYGNTRHDKSTSAAFGKDNVLVRNISAEARRRELTQEEAVKYAQYLS